MIAFEGSHQNSQDVSEVRYKLRTRFFLQSGKGTTGSFLDALVGVKYTTK